MIDTPVSIKKGIVDLTDDDDTDQNLYDFVSNYSTFFAAFKFCNLKENST